MDSHSPRTAVASGMGAIIGGEPMEPGACARCPGGERRISSAIRPSSSSGWALPRRPRAPAVRAAREQRHYRRGRTLRLRLPRPLRHAHAHGPRPLAGAGTRQRRRGDAAPHRRGPAEPALQQALSADPRDGGERHLPGAGQLALGEARDAGAAEGQPEARRRLLRHRPQRLGPGGGMGGGRRAGARPAGPHHARRGAALPGRGPGRRSPSGGNRNRPMRGRRPSPSSRASRRRSTTSCWPRRARGWARRWAISRPPISGRRRTTRPSGSRPIPRTCSASSTRKRRA